MNGPLIMKIIEFANGVRCPGAGLYLEEFDFEAHDGRGEMTVTGDPEKAKRFTNFPEAAAYWQTTSKTKPTREDGKPNRPLTAATTEFIELEKARR